jgi:hypothetical protein
MSIYTYSISLDTANAKLNPADLETEIGTSSINVSVDAIYSNGDELNVKFLSAITLVEETTLTALISAHQGNEPVVTTTPQIVQLSTLTPEGMNEIAITKPDGNAKTFISHNFCDNTTWPSTNDSKWVLAPPTGKMYKVLKAEVQFSHDVQMGSHSQPKTMALDVMAGGYAVPDESKLFRSITDVFDLGNKHYSMNVTVDGVPGMTTVVFDYANTIILKSSWAMSMDFYSLDNTEFGGSHCSVSLIAEIVDEVV